MPRTSASRIFRATENGFSYFAVAMLAVLPTAEVVVRLVAHTGIPSSHDYIVHLVVWVTFLGGMITSRERRHLSMTVGLDRLGERPRRWVEICNATISVAITTALMWSALSMVLLGFDPSTRVGFIPVRLATAVIPAGYLVMAVRFSRDARRRPGSWIPMLGFVMGCALGIGPITNFLSGILPNPPDLLSTLSDVYYAAAGRASVPLMFILVVSAFSGTPLFVVLGGLAYLLFAHSGGVLAVVTNEAYTLLTGNTIPAIPLFTIAGFVLSESKAGQRLVRLFRAWFGWLPGGLLIVAILVCTFFTTFTGASGVTILALGALLALVLRERGVAGAFATGLLTAAGSVGLLFPPSLPVILYGVVAEVSIKNLFIAAVFPGVVMVLTLSAMGIIYAVRTKIQVTPFSPGEALRATRDSIWEILLPIIVLYCYFGGITTLEETGAIAVVYVVVVEVFVTRDLAARELPGVALKCLPIIGGVLVILAAAKALSYFIVDAQIPAHLTAWVQASVHSRVVFLMLLNLALLVTGCFMDIYSAILVVAPLILPLGRLFGVDPLHLGVIFLANLELGFLTPPVGLNLFLASYRFEQPLVTVYRNVLPFFLVLVASVLLITYVPWFSTGLVHLFAPR